MDRISYYGGPAHNIGIMTLSVRTKLRWAVTCFAPNVLMNWILVEKCIIFYIIVTLKKFEMIKIYCEQLCQEILLLVKTCTIILLVKIACSQFSQEILLLIKICTINLLLKIYVWAV
jgi:hypothetical protein